MNEKIKDSIREFYPIPSPKITDFKRGNILYMRECDGTQQGFYHLVECELEAVIYRGVTNSLCAVLSGRGGKVWVIDENSAVLFRCVEDAYNLNPIRFENVDIPESVKSLDLYYQDNNGSCACFVRPFDFDHRNTPTHKTPFATSINLLTNEIKAIYSRPVFTSVEEYKAHYTDPMYSNEYNPERIRKKVLEFLDGKVIEGKPFSFCYCPSEDYGENDLLMYFNIDPLFKDRSCITCEDCESAVRYALSQEKEMAFRKNNKLKHNR